MPIATEPVQSPLSADLQAILRCLSCGSKLDSDDGGGYVCPACKRAYPKVNGIARFVDAQHYAASFGFQWHRYQKTQLDHDEVRESEQNFRMKTALRPEELAGKLVLDVGCGRIGLRELEPQLDITGVDLIERPDYPGPFVRADVAAGLPFADDEFDLVSVGRGLIGDPDWVKKVAAGRYSDIRMFTKKDVLGDLEVQGFVEEAHRGD